MILVGTPTSETSISRQTSRPLFPILEQISTSPVTTLPDLDTSHLLLVRPSPILTIKDQPRHQYLTSTLSLAFGILHLDALALGLSSQEVEMAGPTRSKSATSTPKRAAGTKRKRDESIAPPTTMKRRTKSIKRETNDDEASTTTLTPRKATKTSRLPVKQEMQDCDICAETLPAYRNFPRLSTCDHDATVCSKCFERQFITRIDAHRASGWDACTCPLCNVAVVPEEAQGIIPRTLAKEINVMIKKVSTN